MIRFECDYAEGAHERILERMIATNLEQTPGYGEDVHCENARNLLKKLCNNEELDIHFLVGGTQANLTVIASVLRPHQGVLAAKTGHINVHETGAIEATGHKVLAIDTVDGKLTAAQIQQAFDEHWTDGSREHTVQPGMVYISHPTENGTTYTRKELEEISQVCKSCNLPLFMDGARLGYGMVSDRNDFTMEDLTKFCDVFYIGGTKIGALFGEAVIVVNPTLKSDFRYIMKQKGGMLAKGRLLGIQFETLFEDGLYFQIASETVRKAREIRNALQKKGYEFFYDSMTNQLFPILPKEVIRKLSEKYSFLIWEAIDQEKSVVRFCTSFATTEENVQELIRDILE